MIGLLQRVGSASVLVDNDVIGEIGRGLLVLVAVHRDDMDRDVARLAERILTYRVFPDDDNRMNLSLLDIGGELLLVPQFTLAADTRSGMRPGFSTAASPAVGQHLFSYLLAQAQLQPLSVASGQFGEDMQVSLLNDGPVTFWLEVNPRQ